MEGLYVIPQADGTTVHLELLMLALDDAADERAEVHGLTLADEPALLEALAVGLPTAASRIGGITDIIADGVNGRLLPTHDAAAWAQALTEFVERADASREMGVRGRETVLARFSIPHVADEHLKLFRSLGAKSGACEA